MRRARIIIAAYAAVILSLLTGTPARAAPTAISVTFPLSFGEHHASEPQAIPTAGELRAERQLRLARYGLQIVDAIISAIGYHAYKNCLSCLAYPGGGPRGSAPFMVSNLAGNRPAEADPLVQPFSQGGLGLMAVTTIGFDLVDSRIEKRWSVERREAADIAEIGAHVWGISTWIPEIANIHRSVAIASACGAQWRAKQYGEAFTDGCVNEYYRSGPAPLQPLPATHTIVVCAPARFSNGTYLFATADEYVVASGSPCSDVRSPFQ